jgi:hypothetical protein
MDPVLDGLNQPTAEAYSTITAGQPLRLQLLQVIQQGTQLLSRDASSLIHSRYGTGAHPILLGSADVELSR